MPPLSSTYDGRWAIRLNNAVYVGVFVGFLETSGHARGGKAPRYTTAQDAILLRLRFVDGHTTGFKLALLTKTQDPVTASPYQSPVTST